MITGDKGAVQTAADFLKRWPYILEQLCEQIAHLLCLSKARRQI